MFLRVKKYLKRLIIYLTPLLSILFSIFFNKKIFKSRHFRETLVGWRWVFRGILFQKVLRINSHIPWPVNFTTTIVNPDSIIFDVDDLNNFQSPGCYFQCNEGKIYIGKGTYIGPNTGIITSEHSIDNLDIHLPAKDVVIGKNCWIGMNCVILPGIVLGDHTIVGA